MLFLGGIFDFVFFFERGQVSDYYKKAFPREGFCKKSVLEWDFVHKKWPLLEGFFDKSGGVTP